MAFFNIRQWIDRVSQFPNRRTLTNVEDPTDVKTYDLSRAEGEITTQGTAITGANLTDLENRIGAAFTAVEQAMPEANPAAEATASLTKLKVAGTVYEVEGGGGEPQTGTIEDVAIASFSDGADNVPVSELIVDIEARQEGSGVPSPDNVRAISGFDSGVITVTDNDQITNTYTVEFGQTIYGGSHDANAGKIKITHGHNIFNDLTWTHLADYLGNPTFVSNAVDGAMDYNLRNGLCSAFSYNANAMLTGTDNTIALVSDGRIFCRCYTYTNVSDFLANLGTQEIIYNLVTPIEIDVTPVQVKTLLNNNNIFADTGNINRLVYFKTGCENIARLIEAYSEGDGTQTVLLEASEWDTTTNTITVDVAGVTATSNQEILPLPATSAANIANNKALQACNLMDYGQAAGQITLYAENIPSVDLSIRVIVGA